MRNFTRLLAAALFCGALFSAALVGAQDPTATPTAEATVEATTEATAETTAEATSEATSEATTEATTEATAETTAAPTAGAAATATPTTQATSAGTTNVQTNTSGMVVCDSDLILSLYVAEHYFGFDGVMTAVMSTSTDTSAMVDMTTLDKGQYAALFAAPMIVPPSTVMTQEQMQDAADMMIMDDTAMMNQMASMMPPGTDMTGMTILKSVSVAGEDPACTKLRTQLNRFYTILVFQGMQADMNMGTGSATATINFSTSLSGANETAPADTDGTGTAAVTVDMANRQICYMFSVQNITLPATMAHIHRGAAGVKGDVVVPFNVAPDASGNVISCVKVDPALLQEIATNPAGFYVNIHTSDFPDGAIRGQVSGQSDVR